MRPRRPRSVAGWLGVGAALVVGLAALLAAALVVWRDASGLGADGAARVVDQAADRSGPATAPDGSADPDGSAEGAGSRETVPGRGGELHAAACAGTLELASVSAPVTDPGLVEVSGVAVDGDGVAWVVNDSGDRARVFGLRRTADGGIAVQTVEVAGADNVDWEDVALGPGPAGTVLWLADTGDNAAVRPSVSLYRIPVPAPGAVSVTAEAIPVAYPDGPHDVEAVMAEPDGSVLLLTKEPGRSRIYRVPATAAPGPSPGRSPGTSPGTSPVPVVAEAVGEFPVGDASRSVLTGADLSADGSTVALRTYGSVFVVAVPGDRTVPEALADPDRRCRALPPMELQGEAVALLPDAGGYVTVGEGVAPYLTTVVAPDP